MTEANLMLAMVLKADHLDVAQLSGQEADELLDAINRASTEREELLKASIDQTLLHLPRLLRGPARKIVFG